MGKISLPAPLSGRQFHLFCSEFNAGSKEFAEELKAAPVFVTKGKKASAPLTYTTDVSKLALCDHMLVLLDVRTFTSGDDTAQFIEHIHVAMRAGVHLNCIHEFPSVVGPPRHECEFGLFFGDDWTPSHLTGGPTNLYKEIAFALKGVEWRQPGLVAVASKLAGSAGPHKPIEVVVPGSYLPKKGANKWKQPPGVVESIEKLLLAFDSDHDYIISATELHALLVKTEPSLTTKQSEQIYSKMLESGIDANGDGQISIDELAVYWTSNKSVAATSVAAVELDVASSPKKPPPPLTMPPAADPGAPSPSGFIAEGPLSMSDRVKAIFSGAPASAPPASERTYEANLKA